MVIKAAIDEFVHGGHVVAMVLPSMVLTLGLVRNEPLNLPLLAIAYLITLVVYTYNYYEELDRDRLSMPERAAYHKKKARAYPWLIGGYVALLSALAILYDRRLPELCITAGIVLTAGILYTAYLKRITKVVPGFKCYYVTGVWVLAVVLLYGIYTDRGPGTVLPALFCFLFAKLLVNTIFYDLRDIRSDGREGLKTVPVVLGRDRTIPLLYLLSLVPPVFLLIAVLTGEARGVALVLLSFTIYEFYYISIARASGEGAANRKDYALADYEFLLWPVAVWACGELLVRFGPYLTTAAVILFMACAICLAWPSIKLSGRRKPAGDRDVGRV